MKYRTKTCEDFYGKNYTGKGNRPAVIFSLGFCFNWHIGKGDFYTYMQRPEAFDKNIHAMDAEYNSTSDFFDYMENSEKSDGIFDSNSDMVSEEQIEKYRALEMKARDDGAPKYFGVISFDNDFLKEQGAMTTRSLDIKRIKEIARKSMARMIQTSNKLNADNVFWTAAIHTNTDNVHVHFSICEKECRHRKKDMLEVRAFDALKSSVVNSFVGSENTIELTKMQRQVLLPLFERSSDASREQLAALRRILPKNKNLWQYNRKDMEPFREQVNVCVESIVKNTPSLQDTYDEYLEMLDAQTEMLKSYYGDGNRHLYLNYKKNRLIDLQARLGNSLLKQLAQLDDTILENSFDTEGPEKIKSSSSQEIENIDLQIDSFMQRQLEHSEDEILIERLGDISDYDDEAAEAHPPEKELRTPYIAWTNQFREAKNYLYGNEIRGINPDETQARALLESEGDQGNALADFLLGRLLSVDEHHKSEEAYKRAFEKFSAILPKTEFERCYIEYKLGVMCQRGLGTEKNLDDAVMHFEASGLTPANYALGKLYLSAELYNENKAEHYLILAAENDNEFAQYALGKLKLEQNDKQSAEHWFKLSADKHNNEFAQYALGKLYLSDGYYNHEEARKYYALAAGQGNKYAQAALQRGLQIPGQNPRIEHNKDYLGRGARSALRDVKKIQYQMSVISGELTRAIQRTMNESEHHLVQLISEYEYDQKLQELNMQRQMATRAI